MPQSMGTPAPTPKPTTKPVDPYNQAGWGNLSVGQQRQLKGLLFEKQQNYNTMLKYQRNYSSSHETQWPESPNFGRTGLSKNVGTPLADIKGSTSNIEYMRYRDTNYNNQLRGLLNQFGVKNTAQQATYKPVFPNEIKNEKWYQDIQKPTQGTKGSATGSVGLTPTPSTRVPDRSNYSDRVVDHRTTTSNIGVSGSRR